ncbi:hypothetical protein LOTGIDRAFT_166509 [Lottia gigantea]|uniref:Uncharacterized protein n=1 Tax=Lottia gigantea TaxID=225164 RepID=V3ZTC5_LOTGI|nr:hypothetical protein LOTGIDRAFT_166509 [Lottia gigantea]ESO87622.1 hypothetical protein LOTGIDRAFT_166509 [Lottia gigantea]
MANNTSSIHVILTALKPGCDPVAITNSSLLASNETDSGAVVYIIAVLVFYSFGVLVMIVQYLKTEKKELEEEAALDNFFRGMPDTRVEREHRVNRMAIHAFHTLTSMSYDDDDPELDFQQSSPILVTDL